MRKSMLLVLLLLTAGFMMGCTSGFRYTKKSICPGSGVQNNGKLSSSYASSDFSPLGLGSGVENGFLINDDPYQGAPVYVVNGGADIYGARGRTEYLAGNGVFGAHRKVNGSESGAYYPGNYGLGRHGAGVGVGQDGYSVAGPIRRNAWARQSMQDYNSGAYNYSSQNYNPYPGNTPTRAPRDFLAPNPPSIGP